MKKNVTGANEMIKLEAMIKKLGTVLFVLLMGIPTFGDGAYAQTNAQLSTAIAGGPAAIRNFYNTYAGNAAGLAALDPALIEQSVLATGGIQNLTSQLNTGQLQNLLDELSNVGTTGAATTAAGLLTAISNSNSALGEALTTALGNSFFTELNSIMPGLANALDEALSPIFSLVSGLNDILSGFTALFGGGGGGALSSILGSIGPGSLLGASAGGSGSTALPTSSPISVTCNSNIMVAMETRAWLEAQREVTQNQNLIAKPDSVMEYTCFDSFLNVLAQQAENMFSENTSVWTGGTPALITANDMDNALTQLVGVAVNSYITNNFPHSFLGGRGSDDYTPSSISGAAYTCDRMNAVWMNAKCVNFAARPEDGFLTFQQHASSDPRTLPTACGAEPKWTPYIDAVYSNPAWRTDGSPASFETSITDSYNEMRTYTEAGSCSGSRLILTGLTYYIEGTSHNDAVCLNPGCYYTGTTCAPY